MGRGPQAEGWTGQQGFAQAIYSVGHSLGIGMQKRKNRQLAEAALGYAEDREV